MSSQGSSIAGTLSALLKCTVRHLIGRVAEGSSGAHHGGKSFVTFMLIQGISRVLSELSVVNQRT